MNLTKFTELFVEKRPTFENFELLKVFPQVANIWDVPQDPKWHPEGQVHIHSFHVMEEMWDICKRENFNIFDKKMYMLSAMCHDLAKAMPENGGTTKFREDKQKWVAYGHAKAGVPLTRQLLSSMFTFDDRYDLAIYDTMVPSLVEHHMFCSERQEIKDKHVEKLHKQLNESFLTIQHLLYIIEADQSGRPPLPKGLGRGQKLKEIAERLGLLN